MKTEDFIYNRNTGILTLSNGERMTIRESMAIITVDKIFVDHIVNQLGEVLAMDPDNSLHYEYNWKLINILNDPINEALKKIEEMVNTEIKSYIKKSHPDYNHFLELYDDILSTANDFIPKYLKPFQIIEKKPKMENQLILL